jgi:hypothetical protein
MNLPMLGLGISREKGRYFLDSDEGTIMEPVGRKNFSEVIPHPSLEWPPQRGVNLSGGAGVCGRKTS